MKKLENLHPGEILKGEFLDPMEIWAYRLSKESFIPQTRVSEIIKKEKKNNDRHSIKTFKDILEQLQISD